MTRIRFEFYGPQSSWKFTESFSDVPRAGDEVTLSHFGTFKVKRVRWIEEDEGRFWAIVTLKKLRVRGL